MPFATEVSDERDVCAGGREANGLTRSLNNLDTRRQVQFDLRDRLRVPSRFAHSECDAKPDDHCQRARDHPGKGSDEAFAPSRSVDDLKLDRRGERLVDLELRVGEMVEPPRRILVQASSQDALDWLGR